MTQTSSKSRASYASRAIFAGFSVGASTLLLATNLAQAHNNEVQIRDTGNQRCVVSNGLPNHSTGTFPRKGNPHTISEQSVRLCIPKNPQKGARAKQVRGSIGVALNGVQIRPGTADWYDASSQRGHSRNPASGWNLEGMGAKEQLGMDKNNAHVDERGLYHYHGVSHALVKQGKGTLVGYAADGFEIHYVGNKKKSSYQLKNGTRPSAPGQVYDGTFNQDWSYVAGSGSLDRCNGGTLNGKFVYFATDSYPFFPRCVWGSVSSDFLNGRSAGRGQGGQPPQGRPSRPDRPGASIGNQNKPLKSQRLARGHDNNFGPPPEAIKACKNMSQGHSCSIQTPRGQKLSGTCGQTPDGQTACMPEGHRPPRRQ